MLMERVREELQCENGIVKNANNLTFNIKIKAYICSVSLEEV